MIRPVEHRWGQRVRVDIPVRVNAHPFTLRNGRLANLSVSGGFIKADFDVRVLTRVQISIDLPYWSKPDAPTIAAYVARTYKDGIGVEWCEFAPQTISRLLRVFSARPHIRVRKPDLVAASAKSRASVPLLKHGT